MVSKNGLVLVYDPHNLYQFIWYYRAYAADYDWTALCLPNAMKKEYMSAFCEKTGIFKSVITTPDTSYEARGILEKTTVFLGMMVFFLLGKKKEYCRRILGQYVDCSLYDRMVIITEGGIVSGAVTALADDCDVVILDDGLREYVGRRTYRNLFKKETRNIIAALLSYMGYSSPLAFYPFSPLKNCTKLLVKPDSELCDLSMYKTVYKAYDQEVLPLRECVDVYRKIYPNIDEKKIREAEAVFLLSDYEWCTSNSEYYVSRVVDFINENFRRVVIKTHPMDKTVYKFAPHIDVYEIDREMPGEAIIPYIDGEEIYCLYATTMLMFMQNCNIKMLVFADLVEGRTDDKDSYTKESSERFLAEFAPHYEKIVIE